MDGNGRWAQARNLPRSEGHSAGTKSARRIVEECRRIGIEHVTLYTFSSENWARPKEEVSYIFGLLKQYLTEEIPSLIKQDIRLTILGDIEGLPMATRKALKHAIAKTAHCRSMRLNLALNYSSRDEIVRAAKKIIEDGLRPEDVTEEAFASRLYTSGQPDPDLIIRTSGEQRLSNYLMFQAAYSEFYFTATPWPDFGPEELHLALDTFLGRNRRFGKTGEQVQAEAETTGKEQK